MCQQQRCLCLARPGDVFEYPKLWPVGERRLRGECLQRRGLDLFFMLARQAVGKRESGRGGNRKYAGPGRRLPRLVLDLAPVIVQGHFMRLRAETCGIGPQPIAKHRHPAQPPASGVQRFEPVQIRLELISQSTHKGLGSRDVPVREIVFQIPKLTFPWRASMVTGDGSKEIVQPRLRSSGPPTGCWRKQTRRQVLLPEQEAQAVMPYGGRLAACAPLKLLEDRWD